MTRHRSTACTSRTLRLGYGHSWVMSNARDTEADPSTPVAGMETGPGSGGGPRSRREHLPRLPEERPQGTCMQPKPNCKATDVREDSELVKHTRTETRDPPLRIREHHASRQERLHPLGGGVPEAPARSLVGKASDAEWGGGGCCGRERHRRNGRSSVKLGSP